MSHSSEWQVKQHGVLPALSREQMSVVIGLALYAPSLLDLEPAPAGEGAVVYRLHSGSEVTFRPRLMMSDEEVMVAWDVSVERAQDLPATLKIRDELVAAIGWYAGLVAQQGEVAA